MVEVARTGLFMERVRRQDGRQPTPEQALRWATRNGYRALGLPDGGWLKAGNKADLILVDLERAHLVPVLRAAATFVHQGQASDVTGVMVDGKWLMRDGEVLTIDEERVVAEAQQVANAAWKRQFQRLGVRPPAGFSPDALP
jgi:5-methylthioadenosine/S-adenosylhomocysteine deaminase